MSEPSPVAFEWNGEAMVPTPRFAKLCDTQFVVGENYVLVPHEGRSAASHGHYFAALTEAWRNLPEAEGSRFPSVEHLRKWALIKAGFADERSIVCSSKAEARRLAAFVQPLDGYAVVLASEAVVKVYTAQSQSHRAMGAKAFQESKEKVLEILAGLLGTDVSALAANARAA